MIEAFEIGVSLALRDGVSDSIAQAQRNVEALQKAVDANGLSVRALRDAGVRAVSLVSVQPEQEKGQRQAKPRVAPAETAVTAPAPDTISRPVPPDRAEAPISRTPEPIRIERGIEREPIDRSGDRAASAPVSVPTSRRDVRNVEGSNNLPSNFLETPGKNLKIESVAPTDQRRDPVLQLQTVAPTGQSGEQILSVAGGAEQPILASWAPPSMAVPERESVVLSALPMASTAPGNALQTLPVAQSSSTPTSFGGLQRTGLDDWAPVPAERAETKPQGSSTENEASVRRADSGTLEIPGVAKPAAPDIHREAWPARDLTSSRDQDRDDPGDAAEWRSSLAKLRPVQATTLPRAESAPHSVAPQGRGNAEGPLNGDVYLDGVLVGRWMSRFLKREVERADSGPTGFDAKRGRLLPGVTVGG